MATTKSSKHTIGIIVLVLIILILLARYVVFKTQFEERGAGLERISERQENYKKEYPDATKEQMDQARREGMSAIEQRQAEYKENNPNATDEEMDQAWNALRGTTE